MLKPIAPAPCSDLMKISVFHACSNAIDLDLPDIPRDINPYLPSRRVARSVWVIVGFEAFEDCFVANFCVDGLHMKIEKPNLLDENTRWV
jgi:hypothetical protein